MNNDIDSAELLSINHVSDMTILSYTVGDDATPVMVVDNLFRNPERVRSFALSLNYEKPLPGDYWPGVQAAASLDRGELGEFIKTRFVKPTLGIDTDEFDFPVVLPGEKPDQWSSFFLHSRFGMTTMTPQQAPWVKQPHVDEFGLVASVIYLSNPEQCFGGTVLCQHRATGIQSIPPFSTHLPLGIVRRLESMASFQLVANLLADASDGNLTSGETGGPALITQEQHDLVLQRLMSAAPKAAGAGPVLDDTGYMTASSDEWEILDQVDMRFNRLVMYPTWQLHGVNWDTSLAGATKSQQRLTMMDWLNYPARR